ncbi:MAG: glycosyltransferase 87 family protein [Candidatus Methanomethylophilaceae archaeon]
MSDIRSACAAALREHPLAAVLVLGSVVRLILMPTLTFNIDMTYWVKISEMVGAGFGLYDVTGYYYTPIWGYVVGLFSFIGEFLGITDIATLVPEFAQYLSRDYPMSAYVVSPLYAVMMKLPIVLTDVAVAFMLYILVKDMTSDGSKGVWAFALWYLCPLTIVESSVHGMFDCMSAMSILASFIFLRRKEYVLAGAAFSVSVLTKFFPVYLIFFMCAYVLREEGLDRKGLRALLRSVLGALIALIIIQIPAFINGQFWESLFFLTDRIGISTEVLNSVTSPGMIPYLIVAIIVVGAVLWYIDRRTEGIYIKRIAEMDPARRERIVIRILLALAAVATLGIIVYTVISVCNDSSDKTMDFLEAIGFKAIMLLSIYTILLEIYLAQRLLFSDRDNTYCTYTVLFLSSMVIFLWPPLPQYVIVAVPFMILYAITVSERMVRPFMIFSVLMTLYECVLGNVTALFPLAVYTDLIPLEPVLAAVDFLAGYVGDIPVIAFFVAVSAVVAFLSLLNMLRRWYTDTGGRIV